MNLSYSDIKEMYLKKGHTFFTGPFNVNIFGIRNKSNLVDEFNDVLGLAYQDEFLNEILLLFKGTTDPGSYWLKNRLGHVNGTAILVPGQYRNAWRIGMHRSYRGLIQNKDQLFLVWRDKDQDGELDTNGSMFSDVTGLNMHTTSFKQTIDKVGAYSAGCQVCQDDQGFLMMMALIERSAQIYGNSFTYTLFDEETNLNFNRVMSEKLGIDNIKIVASFGFNLGESLSEKLEDGKVKLGEAIGLIKDLKDVPQAVKSAPKALAEFKDLDSSEKEELLAFFNANFDLQNDVIERRIEKAIAVVAALIDLIQEFTTD